MHQKNRRKGPRFRVLAAMSILGLIFTALLIAYFKKHRIYELEYEFGRKMTALFFIAAVIMPMAYYALEILNDKVLGPLLYKMLCPLEQRRIKKHQQKMLSREYRYKQRIQKVMGPSYNCLGLMLFFGMQIAVILAFVVAILFLPKFDLKDAPTILQFILIFVLPITLCFYLCSVIYVRFFVKKKGVGKALKYTVELKKPPGLLGRLWLKACGISRQQAQDYLDNLH